MVTELFVEGGGNNNAALRTECRKAFSKLFEKAGIHRRPQVVPCGGRKHAYDRFCNAVQHQAKGESPALLVDSEERTVSQSPWDHVRQRQGDQWNKPVGATDDQLHFMAQCMEAWFLADRDMLVEFYGQNFHVGSLPGNPSAEDIDKSQVLSSLASATRKADPPGKYHKGNHSFKLLERLSPNRVRAACPWAARFFDALA